MKTLREIIEEIKEGKSTVDFLIQKLKSHPKVKLYNTEQLTKTQFIEKIEKSDPFELMEKYEGHYLVIPKGVKFTLDAFINPNVYHELDKHYKTIESVYPELKEYFDYVREKSGKNCSECNKFNFAYRTIQGIIRLGCKGRDKKTIENIFGRVFLKKLEESKPNQKMNLNQILFPKNTVSPVVSNAPVKKNKAPQIEYHNWLRPQCFKCTVKHISTALALMKEYFTDNKKYKSYRWEAVGELACAEHECLNLDIELAKKLRTDRLLIMGNENFVPDLFKYFEMLDGRI